MTSDEWKNRLLAVVRAHHAGDPDPLGLTADQIAEMDLELATKPMLAVVPERLQAVPRLALTVPLIEIKAEEAKYIGTSEPKGDE